MTARQSSLFPKRNRSSSSDLKNTMDFANKLEQKKNQTKPETPSTISAIPKIDTANNDNFIEPTTEKQKIKNPNKSHKGIAGRKAEYTDPRLKKDRNAKISQSTKVRIERLISRKFDGKSVGDVIDMALDNLVSTFDRDDRDALFKAYQEDMELLKPIVRAENEKLKASGKRYLELTDEVDEQTLVDQKNRWVNSKFD